MDSKSNSRFIDKYYNSSKLLKHLDRLHMWDKEGYTFPVQAYFEITDACNHKCPECTYPGKRNFSMKIEKALNVVSQLKEMQVRSVTISGGGEPTCHPNLREIIENINKKNMEVSLITNGHALTDQTIESVVNCCTWARISLDANNPEIYKLTHGMDKNAFNRVLKNISKLIDTKKRLNKNITVGISYLFGQFSIKELFNATNLAKELGVDYIRFKPFLSWGGKKYFADQKEEDIVLNELHKCKSLENDRFSVSYPKDRCEYGSISQKRTRNFDKCYFRHFLLTIKPDLKVYDCCVLQRNEKYCLGDLSKNTLREIWLAEDRKRAYQKTDFEDCPNPCIFEKHAELLYRIKQKVPHLNFL